MINENYSHTFVKVFHAIIDWFNQHKRELPWRKDKDPYRVWISEIMLQQTRVDVVIPYYERWMKNFPTLEHLANASIDEVIQVFAGLGYYSRAKNLHFAAKTCIEKHQGKVPESKVELLSLKGIGSYTAGAILSFGFGKKAAAVDGNVLRVMARILGMMDPIDLPKVKQRIEKILEEMLPHENAPLAMEGLIELGAIVCKKKPDCSICPLQHHCVAHKTKKTHLIPLKSKKETILKLESTVFIYEKEDKYFVEKKSSGEWNAGLFEFPTEKKEQFVSVCMPIVLEELKAYITNHEILLKPMIYPLKEDQSTIGSFYSIEELDLMPLSSAHRKIVQRLKKKRIEKSPE
jgi:A/G-specific adenine glycosylase